MLNELSNAMADAVAVAAPSVVQVHGHRRPASGVVHSPDVVVTTMRVVGKEDGVKVRRHDGQTADAELAGWDPATGLAVLRVPGLGVPAATVAANPARVGHIALAIARSWSNAVTASAGLVSVIGGPLPTGRRRSIEQVIRTTAPMHDGFSGGAFLDTTGAVIGVTTAMEIRGLSVVIPVGLAWQAAETVLAHGRLKRGYLGIAGQPVVVPLHQAGGESERRGLLAVGVTADSPASAAGLLVGDVLLALNGQSLASPDDLLDLLVGDIVGTAVVVQVLRGGQLVDVTLTVGERPGR